MPIRCTVLGAGSWGTALAVQLARMGHNTVLWDRHPDRCEAINREHGKIEVMINDTTWFDNVFKTEGGIEHHTGIEYKGVGS